jgi:N-acetylmuramate 1-kinase
MEQRLNQVFAEHGWAPVQAIQKLHGDASYRTYYRVTRTDGTSCILMQMPDGKASASEEITNFQGTIAEPPFIQIGRALAKAGLPVPEIYAYCATERWIILEDCGDLLLGNLVREGDVATRTTWYRKAINLLTTMQARSQRMPKEDCIALQRSFDGTLLNWEFDHFLEYALIARGHTLSAVETTRFHHYTHTMTDQIRHLRPLFTHRDFQSRNVLVRDGELVLLDFQDALMGPYIYDLVSLLRDSYITLSEDEIQMFTGYYASETNSDPQRVRHDFDLVTVQRKMKDAGRFVYIDQVKGNADYLQYLPASLAYVRNALRRLPEFEALLELLTPHIPEWNKPSIPVTDDPGHIGATV